MANQKVEVLTPLRSRERVQQTTNSSEWHSSFSDSGVDYLHHSPEPQRLDSLRDTSTLRTNLAIDLLLDYLLESQSSTLTTVS